MCFSLAYCSYYLHLLLSTLQAWWQKAAPGARKTALMLFNYYEDPSDPRTIRQCIRDSEEYITNKFIKAFPSNASRMKAVCTRIVKSLYPLSRRQLDSYLKKYTDRAELARVSGIK